MELEFTNNEGDGSGRQSWVKYWLSQPHPVMLVIGTFENEEMGESSNGNHEFAAVRWMEIKSYLKRESNNGNKRVKHIVFKGERLDMESIYRLREKALKQ